MLSFRILVCLFALISFAVAIKCYQQTTQNKDKPKLMVACDSNTKYCLKTRTENNGIARNDYACGPSCKYTGCSNPLKGTTICCCKKDFCNSSEKFSMLFSVVPIALIKLLLI